jgi:catechol 2,3-dioxygenase-like lactoylglutathione lyase family enzyme
MSLPNISAIVLFVDDLDKCRAFYQDVLALDFNFSDDASYGFKLGSTDFIVLKTSSAAEMVTEEAMALTGLGNHRTLLCVGVPNVDEEYKKLTGKGVKFINPPKDQAWGRRTAYFADPEGNLWELWHELVG